MLELVLRTAPPGNPDAVLNAIDDYGWKTGFLMNIGDRKGAILDRVIEKYQPKARQSFAAAANVLHTHCG